MRRYLTRYRLPAEINLGCRVLWECVSVCVCECGFFLRIFFFFFNPCVLTPSCLKDKSPISLPQLQPFPEELLDPLYIPMAEAGVGCPLLWLPTTSSLLWTSSSDLRAAKVAGSSETTQPPTSLGQAVPYLPRNTFFFGRKCEEEGGRGSTLRGQLAHLLQFCPSQPFPWTPSSLPIGPAAAPLLPAHRPRLPSLRPPQAAGTGDELCGHRIGPVLTPHVHLPRGHVLGCVYTALRKKQASFLVAL